jgi:iron complex transport system substrate-binding protein
MPGPPKRPYPARGERRHFPRAAAAPAALVLALTFAGCGGAAPTTERPAPEATQEGEEASAEYPLTVEDSLGREVEIGEEPKDLVSMAPSVTETLFAVGAGDRVVGVTDVDDYPKEATEVEVAGDFNGPNVEKVIALETDLLLLSFDGTTEDQAEKLEEQTGAEVFVMNPKSVEQTIEEVGVVAAAVGEPEGGEKVQEEMRSELREVEEAVAGEERPTVFYEVYYPPLSTVGPGSFIHDAIELAGGENAAADAEEAYPTYSEEVLLEKDPDFYLFGEAAAPGGVEDLRKRPGYKNLTALKEDGHATQVNEDLISRPGPRITDGVREIAEAIHPEAFE